MVEEAPTMVAASTAGEVTSERGGIGEHFVAHTHPSGTRMPFKHKNTPDFSRVSAGSPKGNRTPVNAVRGPKLEVFCQSWTTTANLAQCSFVGITMIVCIRARVRIC